jgi:hypothetical protein
MRKAVFAALMLLAGTAQAAHRGYRHSAFTTWCYDTPDGQIHAGEWALAPSGGEKWVYSYQTDWNRGAWEDLPVTTDTTALTEIGVVGECAVENVELITFSGRDLRGDEDAPSDRSPGFRWVLYKVGRGRGVDLKRVLDESEPGIGRRSVATEDLITREIPMTQYDAYGAAGAPSVEAEVEP